MIPAGNAWPSRKNHADIAARQPGFVLLGMKKQNVCPLRETFHKINRFPMLRSRGVQTSNHQECSRTGTAARVIYYMGICNMNISKPWMKIIFIIVLLLTLLPLVLFALVRFAPPVQDKPGTAEKNDSGRTTIRERRARREKIVSRQETTVPETEPDQNFEGVGAVVPNAIRSKRMTPYEPGTVPGDSGVIVDYAGSPDDLASGPQPPPQADLRSGRTMPQFSPENMRGIGGARRIDPNDPFFQQNIPDPFAD